MSRLEALTSLGHDLDHLSPHLLSQALTWHNGAIGSSVDRSSLADIPPRPGLSFSVPVRNSMTTEELGAGFCYHDGMESLFLLSRLCH